MERLKELEVQGIKNLAQLRKLKGRIEEAEDATASTPDMTGGQEITVSIEWLNWMLDFVETDDVPL